MDSGDYLEYQHESSFGEHRYSNPRRPETEVPWIATNAISIHIFSDSDAGGKSHASHDCRIRARMKSDLVGRVGPNHL